MSSSDKIGVYGSKSRSSDDELPLDQLFKKKQKAIRLHKRKLLKEKAATKQAYINSFIECIKENRREIRTGLATKSCYNFYFADKVRASIQYNTFEWAQEIIIEKKDTICSILDGNVKMVCETYLMNCGDEAGLSNSYIHFSI